MTATLNDTEKIKKLDKDNQAKNILELGKQIEDANKAAQGFKLPSNYKGVQNTILVGMGGSAIGSDIVSQTVQAEKKVPLEVLRNYDLPGYVSSKTLVLITSHSGNTEESLSAFNQAVKKKTKAVVVSQGGKLIAVAKKHKLPFFQYSYPFGPRMSLGWQIGSLPNILSAAGLMGKPDFKEALETLESFSKQLAPDIDTEKNMAKLMAYFLFDHYPVIIGSGILEAVARRWKTQVNENGKTFASYEILPELYHNTLEGFDFPKRLPDDTFFVLLENTYDHPQNKKRFQILKKTLDKKNIRFESIMGMGESVWSQKLSMVVLGDWTSFYLAMLNQVNPTPVDTIEGAKKQLAK